MEVSDSLPKEIEASCAAFEASLDSVMNGQSFKNSAAESICNFRGFKADRAIPRGNKEAPTAGAGQIGPVIALHNELNGLGLQHRQWRRSEADSPQRRAPTSPSQHEKGPR